MKTIADFKRKMVLGAKVTSELFWNDKTTGIPKPVKRESDRKVAIVQSNSFALTSWRDDKQEFANSWCDWPKSKDFKPLTENSAEITFPGGKLIYTFTD